jgi:hypothetical protein
MEGKKQIALLILLLLAASCTKSRGKALETTTAATLPPSTLPTATEDTSTTAAATATPAVPTPTASPRAETPTYTPTALATNTPTPVSSPTGIPPTPTPPPPLYSVAFVLSDDVLNVRSGPGVSNRNVGSLGPDARDIQITGSGNAVGQSVWVPIQAGNLSGWVNRYFLTAQVERDEFCQDPLAQAIIEHALAAVKARDGVALSALVHPQRGLLLRRNWWNKEVKFTAVEVTSIFGDPATRDWGWEDGSGAPIVGSVRAVMLPLLERDLVGSTDMVCGEVVGGATAGLLQLPPEYGAVNIYTAYRPAAEDEMMNDWGSWAIGIEYWEGLPYLNFLVYYAWEI